MTNKSRVLFVDDEPSILSSLRRLLRRRRSEWDMTFVGSAAEALLELEKAPYDVIVSDMRMPHMSGDHLLAEVLRWHPSTARMILSGYSADESLLRSVGPAHELLCKPCDQETLVSAISRTLGVREGLSSPFLENLVFKIDTLPSHPDIYRQLIAAVSDPNPSAEAIGNIIAKDIGTTSKILQHVNSAYFDGARVFVDPVEAIRFLGTEIIGILTLPMDLFSAFDGDADAHAYVDTLVRRSVRVGKLAKAMSAEIDGMSEDEAALAGLLHDTGKLMIVSGCPEEHRQIQSLVRDEGISVDEAERRVIGLTHAELGAHLLSLWGISESVVDAVRFHHNPAGSEATGLTALGLVHIADSLVSGFEQQSPDPVSLIDWDYAGRICQAGWLDQWVSVAVAHQREAA